MRMSYPISCVSPKYKDNYKNVKTKLVLPSDCCARGAPCAVPLLNGLDRMAAEHETARPPIFLLIVINPFPNFSHTSQKQESSEPWTAITMPGSVLAASRKCPGGGVDFDCLSMLFTMKIML